MGVRGGGVVSYLRQHARGGAGGALKRAHVLLQLSNGGVQDRQVRLDVLLHHSLLCGQLVHHGLLLHLQEVMESLEVSVNALLQFGSHLLKHGETSTIRRLVTTRGVTTGNSTKLEKKTLKYSVCVCVCRSIVCALRGYRVYMYMCVCIGPLYMCAYVVCIICVW